MNPWVRSLEVVVPVALGLAALAYVGMTLDRVVKDESRWWEFWKESEAPEESEGVTDTPGESLPETEDDPWWKFWIRQVG